MHRLDLLEDLPHVPFHWIDTDWVQPRFPFKYQVLDIGDGYITVYVYFVAIHKCLHQKAKVCLFFFIWLSLSTSLFIFFLLDIDYMIRRRLRFLSKDVQCCISKHRHLHSNILHFLGTRLLNLCQIVVCTCQG